jgi:carbamoyl-phosphate synthase/aspartate carbamoyltransferase
LEITKRIQKERFESVEEYNKYASCYIIDNATLVAAKPELRVMHPLPRVGEIKEEVDKDSKRAAYFREMKNGMFVRMALLALIFGVAN